MCKGANNVSSEVEVKHERLRGSRLLSCCVPPKAGQAESAVSSHFECREMALFGIIKRSTLVEGTLLASEGLAGFFKELKTWSVLFKENVLNE